MRIPSGSTDRKIFFVAVDATDLKTRETGLSTFTVVRSRDGGADATYTTPTITEIDAATMPGVYALTVDEDTTIGAGHDCEEYCVHITHTGMAPVTRTVELYRVKFTEGQAATMANNCVDGDVERWKGAVPASLADTDKVPASVQHMGTDTITNTALAASAVTEIQAGLSTLDAAGVRAAVGLAVANLDTKLADIPTVAEFEARTILAANYGTAANQVTIIGHIDTEIAAILAAIDTEIAAILADTTALNDTAMPEIAAAADAPATPTLRQAMMLLYMWLRNNSTSSSSERRVRNDAGAVVLEGDMADDGTTFQQGKLGTPD